MEVMKLPPIFTSNPPLRIASRLALVLGLMWLAGCAGSSVGDSLQQSLEADPRLEEQDAIFGEGTAATDEEPLGSTNSESVENQQEAADNSESSSNRVSQPPGERSRSPENAEKLDDGLSSTGQEADAALLSSNTRIALSDVAADLRPYVKDLMALQLFSKAAAQQETNAEAAIVFEPNQPITRGQYARWLLTANNLFYSDQPSKKIRAAGPSATPAFQDVPTSHPDFAAIQGLAEAGLIPSALTGNSTAVNFRPDAPLTRESLVLWKVPLDIRRSLPTASVEAVKATWGFQDAADIEPLALQAVLADHQDGDFANILRSFGYTTLLQPKKAVTQAEAAATLWRFGTQTEGISAEELLQRSQVESGSGP